MTFSRHGTVPAALAVGLATVALAGCGGGGDKGSKADEIESKISDRLQGSQPSCTEGRAEGSFTCQITYQGQPAQVTVAGDRATVLAGGRVVDFFVLD